MSVIDDYFSKLEAPQKSELERIRRVVHQAVPEALEVISYGMPAFKYKNKYLVGFNSFKEHLSLFPTNRPIEVLSDKLANYKLSKGTIQFTPNNTLPEKLIKEILLARVNDISQKAKS